MIAIIYFFFLVLFVLDQLTLSNKMISSNLKASSKIVLPVLPKLYIYDHCPFCVRVRLALGLKNVKHELVFLANDDVTTPTNLVGKKVVPIFQTTDLIMPESLDIIAKVDSDPTFGSIGHFKQMSSRSDVSEWQDKVKSIFGTLQRPRYMESVLAEFQQYDSKLAFINNHPIPPYAKKDWKESFSQDQRVNIYKETFVSTTSLIQQGNNALLELDKLLYSDEYVTEGGLSLDDIDLWSRLRSITIIKGIIWPSKLRTYMDKLSQAGDVPLYDNISI